MRGAFITLEGIDGCGKSTQIAMLARALAERGLDVAFTREPGGTPLGEQARRLVLSHASAGITPEAELFLIAASRAQHVAEVIRPRLESGRSVISDRYTDSTVAFQGYGRGLDLRAIDAVNRIATGGLTPDLTIIFDLEPEMARARLAGRTAGESGPARDRFDEEEMNFHHRVRKGYLTLAADFPARIRVLNAQAPAEEIHRQVLDMVLPLVSPSRNV
ncbi:MAG TPA: dTMP kinase [Blastocatellia bacterium]|nr:dTMP kinase [Blastocatellia bacterium]